MGKAELVFIPTPIIGHLVSAVEIAKLLVERDDQLSITVIIMKQPFDSDSDADQNSNSKFHTYTESLAASNLSKPIKFIDLSNDDSNSERGGSKFIGAFVESQKLFVKEAVTKITQSKSGPDSPRLAGFVIDMFCTTMMDVANEFGVPSYVFFTSGAAFLDLMLHLQALHDEQNVDTTEFKDSDAELVVPSLVNPLPARVLPSAVLSKDAAAFFEFARRMRETKGIMVNTFMELESYAVEALSDGKIPTVYPVGPMLNLKDDSHDVGSDKNSTITKWLDDQPPSSVVFLCFGSMGSFGEVQVKEIARALEQSGHRFLWSLRQPAPTGTRAIPGEYTNVEDVLPQGFLDRTVGIGKVIGWAPQVAILAHQAIGGFVSHCGWNSTLESLWFGVPIAAWPMYAEQQLNAFEMVKELGLAVEVKMDYRKDFMNANEIIVSAEEIERGIRRVMDHGSEIRKKVKEMSEKSRKALIKGGSSYISLGNFIEDVIENMSL